MFEGHEKSYPAEMKAATINGVVLYTVGSQRISGFSANNMGGSYGARNYDKYFFVGAEKGYLFDDFYEMRERNPDLVFTELEEFSKFYFENSVGKLEFTLRLKSVKSAKKIYDGSAVTGTLEEIAERARKVYIPSNYRGVKAILYFGDELVRGISDLNSNEVKDASEMKEYADLLLTKDPISLIPREVYNEKVGEVMDMIVASLTN